MENDSILETFKQTWYLGSKLAIPQEDGRLPAIEGEFDLPWDRIGHPEDILTEEEKIKECSAKLYFSADYLINENRITTRSHHLGANTKRYCIDDGVRSIVGSLRYKRQKDRYWCHPIYLADIEINETKNHAIAKSIRIFGWKQRNHEYNWTKDNVNIEHACTWGYVEFVKEEGIWKIADSIGKLGIYELGPYSKGLYRE